MASRPSVAIDTADPFRLGYGLGYSAGYQVGYGSRAMPPALMGEAAARAREMRAIAGVGDRMAEVIAYVTAAGTASPAEVAQALGLEGRQARVYLGRAVAAGRLRKAGRGAYTPVASVAVLLQS